MCGITVFLSKENKNIIPLILDSLLIIQNRGYDSVGIAMKCDNWEFINMLLPKLLMGLIF